MRTFLRSSLLVADMLGGSGITFVQLNRECDLVRVFCTAMNRGWNIAGFSQSWLDVIPLAFTLLYGATLNQTTAFRQQTARSEFRA